jgi:hypothetical protein
MGILKKLKKTMGNAEEKLQHRFLSKAASSKPLRIQREILDEIEDNIQLRNRTHPLFPSNTISIYVLAENDKHRDALEAVFFGDNSLEDQITSMLREADVRIRGKLEIEVKLVNEANDEWEHKYFHIDFPRTSRRENVPPQTLESFRARLNVTEGRAGRKSYFIRKSPFYIGRLPEVTDTQGRIIRRNDLVFLDKGDELTDDEKNINNTVSRAHAQIRFDEKTSTFRLLADRGTGVTRLLRNGRIIKVPALSSGGTKLQSGDEIYLGRARVSFQLHD